MWEVVLILLAILLVLWVIGCLVGLPIVAVLQMRRTAQLAARVRELEERLGQVPSLAARPAAEVPHEEPVAAEIVDEQAQPEPARGRGE